MTPPAMDRIFGALGPACVAAAAAAAAARLSGGSRAFRASLAAAGAAAVLLPAGGFPIWCHLRGVAGDLSVTSIALLLGAAAAAAGKGPFRAGDVAAIAAAAALAGLLLYPTAAGFTPFDAYRLGWRPFGLACWALAFSLWAWVSGRRSAALVPLGALLAFDFRALESANLWDYLLDPFLVLFSWGWWLAWIGRAIARRRPEKR